MAVSNLASKIQSFSQCYQKAAKIWRIKAGLSEDLNLIKNDAYLAIKFLTLYFHERAGANPNFPEYHRLALQQALEGRKFDDTVINDPNYPITVWKIFSQLAPKPNEKLTKGAVEKLLKELRKRRQPNLIKLLGEKGVKDASEFLRNISGIGPKISALILRDLQCFFNFWSKDLNSNKELYYLLQPVDRWVRRIAELCWRNIELPESHDRAATRITEKCLNDGADPVEFNQGAWFIGRYFSQLLHFHKLPQQNVNSKAIESFKPNKVRNGIDKFEKEFSQGNVFPV